MAYYGGQGDYYRGVGDPGLFDFVGHALGGALNFIPGGGAVVGAARTLAGAARRRGASFGSVALAPVFGTTMMGQSMARAQAEKIAAERGMLHTRGGKHLKRLPKHLGGRGFGHRRMNVANVRALKRSIRRLVGFYELSHKVMKELSKLAHKRGHRFHTAPAQHRLPAHRGQRLLAPPRGDFYEG